jgi:hypothetical protein
MLDEILVVGSIAGAAAHFAGSSAAVFTAMEHLASASGIVAVASKIGSAACDTPVLKSTEPKPPYVCPGCLITCITTI